MEINGIGRNRRVRHDSVRTTGKGTRHHYLTSSVLKRLTGLDVDINFVIIGLVVLIPMDVPGAVAARQHVFINHRRDDGARECFAGIF